MNVNEVIKYPILSEKTHRQMAEGVYSFIVDQRTNKVEVRKTVEFIFEVKVDKVNIINYDRRPKKLGKFQGFTNAVKKAVVHLAEGGKINIFPEEVEAPDETKETKSKEVKAAEPSEAERKAAAKIAAKAAEKSSKSIAPETDPAAEADKTETETE